MRRRRTTSACTSVEFRATGGALNDAVVATGTLTIYGWLGFWNTIGVAGRHLHAAERRLRRSGQHRPECGDHREGRQHRADRRRSLVPSNGGSVRGTSVILDASATDAVGVTRVEFRATGGALNNALIGTGTLTDLWLDLRLELRARRGGHIHAHERRIRRRGQQHHERADHDQGGPDGTDRRDHRAGDERHDRRRERGRSTRAQRTRSA